MPQPSVERRTRFGVGSGWRLAEIRSAQSLDWPGRCRMMIGPSRFDERRIEVILSEI